MAKHGKYRILLTFDDLLKNVKKAILNCKSTRFKGVDKKTTKFMLIPNECEYSVRYWTKTSF